MITGLSQSHNSPWQAMRVGALRQDLQRIDQRLTRLDDVLRALTRMPVPASELCDAPRRAPRR